MTTPDTQPSLRDDNRGAIMLLGIFMCASVVGVMWYVAGLGDAVVYRQRMQEAADATAFSAAVLSARGMNLIVLINLIMAAVLAVRVALKMTQTILQVAGGTMLAIGAIPPPWNPLSPALLAAGNASISASQSVGSALQSINPLIDRTLEALHMMWDAIRRLVPPAASAGSVQVGGRYTPVVDEAMGLGAAVAFGNTLTSLTLPVEDGTEDKLCAKANDAVQDLIDGAIGSIPLIGGPVMFVLNPVIDGIQAAGSSYFCGLGSGGEPPNLDDLFADGAEQACDEKVNELEGKEAEQRDEWLQLCSDNGVFCQPVGFGGNPQMTIPDDLVGTPTEADLRVEMNEYVNARNARRAFDEDQCQQEKIDEQKQDFENQEQDNYQSSGGNKTPAQVDTDWHNGHEDGQLVSVVFGDRTNLNRGEEGVRVGAQRHPGGAASQVTLPASTRYAFAQAEFFYDCSGAFDSASCNREEEAMWNFRWRARFRRWNEPLAVADLIAEFGVGLFWGETVLKYEPSSLVRYTGPGNSLLKLQLAGEIADINIDSQEAVVH